MHPVKFTLVPALLLLLFGFPVQPYPSAPIDTTQTACQRQAMRLLDEALAVMQKHYYKKDSVQWSSPHCRAKEQLQGLGQLRGSLQTVNWCFGQLKENHSFLMPAPAPRYTITTPTRTGRKSPSSNYLVGDIEGRLLDAHTAYISIPWVGTTDSAIWPTWLADSLQQLIARLDRYRYHQMDSGPPQKRGGNCWPMLAGVGPLLGNGTAAICVQYRKSTHQLPGRAAMHGKYIRCRSTLAYK